MPVTSGLEAILLLLYTPGPTSKIGEEIRGITRVDKMLYILLRQEGIWSELWADLNFEPYEYGPYSNKLYDYVETLKDSGLITAREIGASQSEQDVDALVLGFEGTEGATPKNAPNTEAFALSDKGRRAGEKLFSSLTSAEREASIEIVHHDFDASLNGWPSLGQGGEDRFH